MYHVIGEPPAGAPFPGLYVSPARFRAHIHGLAKRGYRAITLATLWAHWRDGTALPPRPVVVTFDDGYRGVATDALPVLRRVGWPAVLNLKVGNLRDAISQADVEELVGAGWEIGAHTITHPDLTAVPAPQLVVEVAGSRREIERRFGVRVRFFCYPAGRFDARVVEAVRRAGFVGATTTRHGLARRESRFALDRVRVDRGDTAADVVARIESAGAGS